MKNLIIPLLLTSTVIFKMDAQQFALDKLEKSPRHHEWIKVASGDREVTCFVAYPEVSEKTAVVIVIHENMGLTPWVRSFADQLAASGYIAIAPDLLSDFSSEHKTTATFGSGDEARNAIYKLDPTQVMNDLIRVQEYAVKMDAGNGNTVVAGFCWGGMQSFNFATHNRNIKAALVFYGSAPVDQEEISRIMVPVYAFYAGNDERINAGIADTEKMMTAENKTYDYVIYPGAGHGFMRQGDDPQGPPENRNARDEAWKRLKGILAGFR